MQIGAAWRQLPKGKGKGKGKDKGKSKAKSESDMDVDSTEIPSKTTSSSSTRFCDLCGSDKHDMQFCWWLPKWCYRCGREGHLANRCRTKHIGATTADSERGHSEPAPEPPKPIGTTMAIPTTRTTTANTNNATSNLIDKIIPKNRMLILGVPDRTTSSRQSKSTTSSASATSSTTTNTSSIPTSTSTRLLTDEQIDHILGPIYDEIDKIKDEFPILHTKFKTVDAIPLVIANIEYKVSDITKTINKQISDLDTKISRMINERISELDTKILTFISDKFDTMTTKITHEYVRVSELKHNDFLNIVTDKFEGFSDAFETILNNDTKLLRELQKHLSTPTSTAMTSTTFQATVAPTTPSTTISPIALTISSTPRISTPVGEFEN
jgi:succinate dehydrogenase flavin-adding protein (antitoxin of CptAB toxin-antitoxin module)